MNPFDLSSNHFEARKKILIASSSDSMSRCVEYINEKYESRGQLKEAVDFCFHDLIEAPKGDVESLAKVGFFPWVEASKELDQSLSLILKGHFKHAYDSYRRAIELVITGAFYVSDDVDKQKAQEWMKSDRSTPNFKRACEALVKGSYFGDLNKQCNWLDDILDFFWKLSDKVHVKGIENSFSEVSPVYSFINGIGDPVFSEKGCKPALDTYLLTVSHIAVVVAASNPFVLQGFDLDIKFGLNPPASGFFYPRQAERLAGLIPTRYKPYFERLLEVDENLIGIRNWFESLPDITEEDVRAQAEAMGFDERNT
ncbi:hypothetical protein DEU29_1404 [Idiomarina aquatica]|uniref:Uncharacterized protein n=1 Tax=Idiomarina aquatica TaxID=1327752 RepID=A0A4R6NX13_9GAMM|nr:hypothetical protein [Idiomarina aquatica]TDP26983.1 hypothetical protein DEU29_1404 [Idiomarina aquatica]